MSPRTAPDPRPDRAGMPRVPLGDTLRIGILCHPTYGGSGVVASESMQTRCVVLRRLLTSGANANGR